MLEYLHLVCGSLPGGCSVFLGFKGGLGVRERSDEVELSPSVVIATPLILCNVFILIRAQFNV